MRRGSGPAWLSPRLERVCGRSEFLRLLQGLFAILGWCRHDEEHQRIEAVVGEAVAHPGRHVDVIVDAKQVALAVEREQPFAFDDVVDLFLDHVHVLFDERLRRVTRDAEIDTARRRVFGTDECFGKRAAEMPGEFLPGEVRHLFDKGAHSTLGRRSHLADPAVMLMVLVAGSSTNQCRNRQPRRKILFSEAGHKLGLWHRQRKEISGPQRGDGQWICANYATSPRSWKAEVFRKLRGSSLSRNLHSASSWANSKARSADRCSRARPRA